MPKIMAVCMSEKTGTKKRSVKAGVLVEEMGLEGDAHAGTARQVSLLSLASIRKMEAKGLVPEFGMFAENLVVDGIDIDDVEVGRTFTLPSGAVIEVTGIGKTCHSRCEIYKQVGDCIMPREGFFARVIRGGAVAPGDDLE